MEKVPAHAGGDAAGDGEVALLVRHVRVRLAERDARAEGLVVGVWRPWDGLCVVALAGAMDTTHASELRALDGRLGPDPCQLIVELSHVTFMDSGGVSQLVTLANAFRAAGGGITLAAPTAPVSRMFEGVNLSEFTPVEETLEAALTHTSHRTATPRRQRVTTGA
jgi:anti-anti-sigma factor